MPADNLHEAQQRMSQMPINELAIESATALALIDIGRTLREISDELHTMNLYGIKKQGN